MNEGKLTAIPHCPRFVVNSSSVKLWGRESPHPRIGDHRYADMHTIGGMDYKKTSGARIKELREGRDWSLQDLSRRTKDILSRTRIQNYESGKRMVGPHEAVILATALGTRPAYIMGVDDIQLPITPQEEALVKNWRKLPESERMHYFRQIEQLALTWSDSHAADADVERHFPPPAARTKPRVAANKRVKAR